MKVHINYAHGRFINAQMNCCRTALEVGGFDKSIPYKFEDIDSGFVEKNQYTFSQQRGAGCWLWKPYLILKTLRTLNEQDWLMYTDSGMHFVRNPWDIILSKSEEIGDKGIATFCDMGVEKNYTKRDTFVLMNQDEERYTNTKHRLASIFVCRKTDFSVRFLEEWLKYASDCRILTDLANTQKLPNYPEFSSHRHDQSIMSLLCKKHETYLFDLDLTHFSNQNPYIVHTRNPN